MSIFNAQALLWIKEKLPVNDSSLLATLNLLYTEQCTIPFIARYRKEATGNLDEVLIRNIQKNYDEFLEVEKRQKFICETIQKLEKLTPELAKKIMSTYTLVELDDLYEPYKSLRKTKATIAKDFGLEPLANLLSTSSLSLEQIEKEIGTEYKIKSNGKITQFSEALSGAADIIVENIAQHLEAKKKLREIYWNTGLLASSIKPKTEMNADVLKFKDFFDFKEPLQSLKNKKSSHRYLAMRRGLTLKILRVEVECDQTQTYPVLKNTVFPQFSKLSQKEFLEKCLHRALDNYLHTSLDLEIKTELKNIADEAAINVFGVNLKNLLLQPYLGSKPVLGIDPGQRTGCKIVVIDENGKLIGDHVIYPHPPQSKVHEAALLIQKILEQFNIEHIAVGNGTAGLDTLHFLQDHIPQVKEGKCKATLVNEAGASIYSASDIAREEFPDKDVTVRGAISIAKRFQDPLAELVKIDAKSIGVGQYQHDVNQTKLNTALDSVVESCVNFVGVDLNTASAPLLSYVSGIGPTVAKNIVEFRQKKGQFKNRQELLKVARFSDKIFTQAAGFLRIYRSDNPLDATFIHPEKYSLIENWCQENKTELTQAVTNPEIIQKIAKDEKLKDRIGMHSFEDIVKALKSPKQDPRSEFKNTDFNKLVKNINDLQVGAWYTGIVSNITHFGAFVDIGIKESGLLHISEMANKFVENALDHIQVGQEVKVRVVSVDSERKRIALSCKEKSNEQHPPKERRPTTPSFSNNPFSNLLNKNK